MATTLNRTFYGGSTAPGSGVYPEDVKILKVFANYAETDYDPLANSDTSVYIPTVDKHSHDDGNIVSIIDRVLAAGGSPIVTKYGAEFTYSSGNAFEYKFVNVSGDNITEMTINRTTGTVTTQNNFLARPVEVEYGVSTASDVASIIDAKGLPYMKVGDIVANLYKIEVNKYTFRTTHLRVDDDINYLDIVDYVVTGSTWTTVTKTVSSGETGTAYLRKVSSPASFDTTGLSGLQTVAGVNDVPNDGVYQVSVMLSVTPKTANATKSDLVFGFYGADGIGMTDHTFHAVVDDSQTFAQQLSFSTTLNLKAGANSLKLSCDGLNTNYLVFVDDLTIAQLVNGVYHNGDDFDEVHTLPEAPDFNNDDGVLVDGATGGPRFMLWRTLKDKVLGILKNLFGVANEPEYLYVITDSSGTVLFSIEKDGTVNWPKGIPSQIRIPLEQLLQTVPNKVDKVAGKSLVNSTVADEISVITNEEYLLAIVDSSDRILFSINKRGEIDFQSGLPDALSKYVKRLDEKEDRVPGKSLVNATFADGVNTKTDITEYAYVVTDDENRVLFSIDKSGMIEGKFQPGETQFFNTVADMMACTNPNLRFAVTMGFYSVGDGGACKYVVGAGTPNGFSSFRLASGRVARLVIEENYLYPEQVGYTNTDTNKDLRTYLFYITRDLLVDTVRFYNRRYYQNGPWIVPRQGISLIGSCNSGNQQSDGIYYFTRIFYSSTRTDDGACVFNCEYREFRLENLEIRNLDASDPSKPPRIGIYTLKFNDDPSEPDYHKNNHYDMIIRNVVIGEFEYGLNLTGNIKWNLQIDNVRCNSCTYGCRIFGHVLVATFKLFYPDHCKVGVLIDTLSVAVSFLYCNFGTVERCIVFENGIEASPYGQYTFVGCNFELDAVPSGPRPALYLDIEESYRAMITMIGCNFNFGLIGQSQYTNQCFCFKLSDQTELTMIGCQQSDSRWNDQLFNPSYPAKKKLGSVKIIHSENVVRPNYSAEYLPTMDIDGSIITDSLQVLERHYSDAAPGSIVYDRTADKAYIKLLNTYKEV